MNPERNDRKPVPPAPLERYDLPHPAVPQLMDGFRILHLADLHVARAVSGRPTFRALLRAMAAEPVDLVVLSGDFMDHPGSERYALDALAACSEAWNASLGAVGVFGNHDTRSFEVAARAIPGIRWLCNRSALLRLAPGVSLRVFGASHPDDLLAALLYPDEGAPADLSIAVTHYPTMIYPAAAAGIPLVFSGHTHGGQIRPVAGFAPHTACNLPPRLASGKLAIGDTCCCISRGVGYRVVNLRFNCPPQVPVYTLRTKTEQGRRCEDRRLRRIRTW